MNRQRSEVDLRKGKERDKTREGGVFECLETERE